MVREPSSEDCSGHTGLAIYKSYRDEDELWGLAVIDKSALGPSCKRGLPPLTPPSASIRRKTYGEVTDNLRMCGLQMWQFPKLKKNLQLYTNTGFE